MGKILVDSGRSSAATHRLTQTSTTLNRRYVRRPSNLAVDAAAHAAELREQKNAAPRVAPSRLVNLGVRTADLDKEKSAELAAAAMPKSAGPKSISISTPNIVEFGCDPSEMSSTSDINQSTNGIAESMSANTESASDMNQSATAITKSASDMNQDASMLPATVAPAPEVDTATLAAAIAADYAATSLGISMKEFGNGQDYAMATPESATMTDTSAIAESATEMPSISSSSSDSVEAIALAASNAIASIREATDPDQVSDQVASLKAFADNIKANQSMPEMRELSDTIDKFVSIAMKSTKVQEENERNAAAKVTLSPKVTRAAAKVTRSSAKVMAANNRTKANPAPIRTNSAMMNRNNMRRRPTAQELKAGAIESALASVATMEERGAKTRRRPTIRHKTGAKRFAFAFICAIICVGAVICYVGSNIPDISVRVAAMQTGIQAAYPSYIPRDYSLGDISSEDGKITMVFNGPENSSFKLIEEKSSWDSPALLRNYVEPSWGEAYATTHEQGITIYISEENSNAAWVNGGVLYKITSSGTALTKKQVRSIVTSM